MIWTYSVLILTVLGSGAAPILIKRKDTVTLKLLLAFSAAFLIGITFLNLIPEVFQEPFPFIGLFVLLGFLLQLVLELLTKGAEHGHEHDCKVYGKETHVSPFLLMTGLCIHAFLEGIPIVPAFSADIRSILVTGIVIHNIPISLALAGLFIHYGMRRYHAMGLLLVFALMTPLGSVVSRLIQGSTMQGLTPYFHFAMAVVIGIFLHVSTSILFETEQNHQYNLRKFVTVILGLTVAFAISLLGHSQ